MSVDPNLDGPPEAAPGSDNARILAVDSPPTSNGGHAFVDALLHVKGLTKHFPVTSGVFGRKVGDVRAVDDVSFDIRRGETLGLVGESGCGKTTVGRCVLRLLEPTSGTVVFDGAEVTHARERDLGALRRNMQVIFQDPFSSLNPRMRVIDIVGEAMEVHGIARGRALEERVVDLLRRVGLSPGWINRYPHEFSGGQRQRIGIARAIALEPKLIVCDEAVSALDVSIQAQIVNLLIELRREMNLGYLFIAHDLSVVRHISHRVAVMYLGEIAELAPSKRLFEAPSHPYTRALLSAIPVVDPKRRPHRLILYGDVPTPRNPPSGCRFHTRCPAVMDRCRSEKPPAYRIEDGHDVACFHAEHLGGSGDWFSELSCRIEGAIEENRNRSTIVRDTHGAPSGAASPEDGGGTADHAAPPSRPTAGRAPQGERGGATREQPGASERKRENARLGRAALLIVLAVLLLFWIAVARFERHRTARREVLELSREVAAREKLTGSYPADLGELGWRLYSIVENGRLTDPWGHAFRYKSPGTDGRPFDLGSTGPDGVKSDDDIGNVPP